MNETTDVRVIESARRHARNQVAIVDKAVMDAAEFDFDIIAEIVQAYARLAEGVEAIDREQRAGIVRAGPACEDGERTAVQRYACYAPNAAGIIGLITALVLWTGGPPQTSPTGESYRRV